MSNLLSSDIIVHNMIVQERNGHKTVLPTFHYERLPLTHKGKPRKDAAWKRVSKKHLVSVLGSHEIRKIQTGGAVDTILARYRATKVV